MTRLTMQYADYWNCFLAFGESTVARYKESWEKVLSACHQHGRDPGTLKRNVSLCVNIDTAPFPVPGAEPISGSPEQVAEQLAEFAAEGIEHCTIVLNPFTKEGIEAFAKIADQVRSN